MKKSPTIRWILLVAALALAGYYGWYRFHGTDVASKSGPTPPPVRVSTAPVEKSDFPVYLTGLGTVQAFNTVVVRTRVDGQIDSAESLRYPRSTDRLRLAPVPASDCIESLHKFFAA